MPTKLARRSPALHAWHRTDMKIWGQRPLRPKMKSSSFAIHYFYINFWMKSKEIPLRFAMLMLNTSFTWDGSCETTSWSRNFPVMPWSCKSFHRSRRKRPDVQHSNGSKGMAWCLELYSPQIRFLRYWSGCLIWIVVLAYDPPAHIIG